MGGTVSSGVDNDELVDNLLVGGRIKTKLVERICRSVDRAFYFFAKDVKHAYKDVAWKRGNTHLSAPCIYSEVMENLDLEPGLSFLNIGSGTGYLSTMVGLVLGSSGVNHGIELHEEVVAYAYEKLELFKTTSNALDAFDFCEPVFVKGNSLNLKITRQYDRVYCGAECPVTYQPFINELIKVGGVLVMPVEDTLMKYKRLDETRWVSTSVLPVSFAPLIIPSPEDKIESISLPPVEVLSLQALCRSEIRNLLRQNARKEYPEIDEMKRSQPVKKKRSMRQCRVIGSTAPLSRIRAGDVDFSLGVRTPFSFSPLSNLIAPMPPLPPIELPSIPLFSDELSDDNNSISTLSSFSPDYLFRHSDISESDSLSSESDEELIASADQSAAEDGAQSSSSQETSKKPETVDSSDLESSGSENCSLKRRTKRENLEAKRQRVRSTTEVSSSSNLSFSSVATDEKNGEANFSFSSVATDEKNGEANFSFSSVATDEKDGEANFSFSSETSSGKIDEERKEKSNAETSSSESSFSSATSNEMEVEEPSVRCKENVEASSSSDTHNDDSSNSNDSFEEIRVKESNGVLRFVKEDKAGESSEPNEDVSPEEDQPSKSEPAITYSSVMKAKVKALPLPHALKCYLNYYRDF